jgi:hypothetical protein
VKKRRVFSCIEKIQRIPKQGKLPCSYSSALVNALPCHFAFAHFAMSFSSLHLHANIIVNTVFPEIIKCPARAS